VEGVGVRLVGPLDVRRHGADAASAPATGLGSRKARRLLALLAASHGQLIPTARIVDALWPDGPPRRPAQDVATLVSRLRGALGPGVIIGGREGYRLGGPPDVSVDIDEAARLTAECRRQLAADAPVLAATAGRRVLELLAGDVVLADEPDTEWVRVARDEQASLLRDARHATSAAELAAGDLVAARRAAEAAVRDDPFDEAAVRLLMSAAVAAGEPGQALTAYQRLRVTLADELGVQPAPQTRAIYQAVLREQPAEAGFRAAGAPAVQNAGSGLAGRAAEVAAGIAAWSAACEGHPAILLVAGEGGIGKTRLSAEIVAAAEVTGGRVLTARCNPGERSLFLQPLIDALGHELSALPQPRLRELAGARSDALVGLLPDLADVLGPVRIERASPDTELRRAFEAVAGVLRGLAAERPTLLLLDDLHNAGLATVELLAYLARRAAGVRLLVLATVRVEEGAELLDNLRDLAGRIDLGPLPATAVAELAAAARRPELAEAIVGRTRGHTLFVVETLRWLTAGETGVPESLQAVVLARLRRAGAETEQTVRAAAVIGTAVDPAVVAGLLDLPAHLAAQRCAQAAAARLLVEAGRAYEFANDLVQEVVYATTAAPLRAVLHRRAADLLTADPTAVARHAAAVEDWSRAARALLLAAEETLRRYAIADGEALLTDALVAAELAEEPELVGRAHLARGRVREARGAYGPALEDCRAALVTARRAGDRRLEMHTLRELAGHVPVALGHPFVECGDRAREGLRIAEMLGDRAMQADLLARLAVLATSRLDFAGAVELGSRSLRAGRMAGSEAALASGLDGLKTAYAYLGQSEPLGEIVHELEPLLRKQGDLKLLPWTVFEGSFGQLGRAEWDAAERSMAAALELNERGGYISATPWFQAHVGWVCRLRGRMGAAESHGRRAVELATAQGRGWFWAGTTGLLACTLLELGRPREALELLPSAIEQARREGAPAYLLRSLAPLAEADGSAVTLAEADALLATVATQDGAAWLLGLDTYLCVARAWLAAGEPSRARARLAPLLVAARAERWVPALAYAGLVDGTAAAEAGDPGARELLVEAAELAAAHGMPLVADEAWRVLAGAPD
jgi:DNA-binding SARP family transcriptional activator/tetratricopeptide (TPR) repeat protein